MGLGFAFTVLYYLCAILSLPIVNLREVESQMELLQLRPGSGSVEFTEAGCTYFLTRGQAQGLTRMCYHQLGIDGYAVDGSGRLKQKPLGTSTGEYWWCLVHMHKLSLLRPNDNVPTCYRLTTDGIMLVYLLHTQQEFLPPTPRSGLEAEFILSALRSACLPAWARPVITTPVPVSGV